MLARAAAALHILGLISFVGLGGCQSTPAPIIVGDTYTNIEYEYSLQIPRGWAPLATIPDELKYFEKRAKSDMSSLLLYNEKSGGLIAVLNIAHGIAFERFLEVSDAKWNEIVALRKAIIAKDAPDMAIKHILYTQNLYATQQNYFASQFAYKPQKFLRVESSFQVAGQKAHLRFDDFIFPCRNTQSCETIIILTCLDKDLAQNQPAFEAVLSSLQAHDYFE
jgi:hypothetical protein